MTLLNDEEKVTFLIGLLERHIDKLPSENSFANYLESIRGFLKTKDPILQKAAFSNSELFIDNFSHTLNNCITSKQAVGSLIAAFEKVGYADSMDVAAVIIEFENLLQRLSIAEVENLYKERWMTDK
ncbi:hypothetical protein [Paenibacillus sp. KN14-4R]|uniref:hypothetical protein n=1 Tax=Paenibacillus sp. KN14-4R TaxID=3445773 RepID=UPI003FA0D291